MEWTVHKFGGSSVAGAQPIKIVGKIIQDLISEDMELCIVVSAMGGITDRLIALYESAIQNREFKGELTNIISEHKQVVEKVLTDQKKITELKQELDHDFNDIKQTLHALQLSQFPNEPMKDLISGYGEIWASKILVKLVDTHFPAKWIDARDLIIVDKQNSEVEIKWDTCRQNLQKFVISNSILVIPGFIASSTEGVTTLGRNGSDLSASILSVLLNATELNIWTDVDGIYSADPNIVDNAMVLENLSYLETLEMAYFGASVLHPKSINPVISHNIPIYIRNTFNMDAKGTNVSVSSPITNKFVKSFAVIKSIAILTIEGAGMIGVPGISETLFKALREKKISVIMISQASSEFSISVAISEDHTKEAKQAVEKAFEYHIHSNAIRGVSIETNVAILSVVGDNMVHQPGIASMLFSSLARARINVRMISQGSSERNISVIIDENEITRALNAAHAAFYLSKLTVSVGLIGVGLIGSSLLNQLRDAKDNLSTKHDIDVQINAIANSRNMYLRKDMDLQFWKANLDQHGNDTDIDEFASFVRTDSIPHTVIIDCTSSNKIAEKYTKWLDEGIHVITPNKKANSGPIEHYKELRKYIDKGPATNPLDKNTYYFYETTVGAGLPIIQTLKDLMKTGDRVISIEGIFSGTLSYLFNTMDNSSAFSSVVRDAKDKGYTEPDPRDDLSGTDVARKLIILARELGLEVEMEDVIIESLIPKDIDSSLSVNEFLDELENYDDLMDNRLERAVNDNRILRYVGEIDQNGSLKVGIKELSEDHPFGSLKGSENIISFTTKRYSTYPLIVRGPGAGAEVTSAGIFADLLRLVERLGSA